MAEKVPYGFIYETINKVNGKKYIGKCIYARQNDWKKYLGSGLYLTRAMKKYGKENFEKVILEEAYTDEELNAMEERYILERNAVLSPDYYNIKMTSIGGDIFTTNPRKEEIRLMRKSQMSGTSNHQYGKPKTERMINSVKAANNRAVLIEGIEYKSQTEAAKALGMSVTKMSYRLDSDNFPDWKRAVPKNQIVKKMNNPTCKVEIDGVVYASIKEAAKAIGTSTATTIRRLDNDKFPTYKRLSERIR
ncbi:hypothetical protein [Niallia nealsonii]|uniref:GIY-YIG domain-containing protein n=1 Tax=Niallia nealsonii TaxID=115979 RepID=A0A2N0Z589_9BACI|nr:hypothetical protein [Niallia nealsonii]PKG24681.1 hypothetical protein CWS01_05350 [Niallia nealsonii]